MKILLSLLVSLSTVLTLSSLNEVQKTYAVTSCQFRFLDNSSAKNDLPKVNGVTEIEPNTVFYVHLYNLNPSTSYRIVGRDSSGNQFTDGGGEKPSSRSFNDSSPHATFGPINNAGRLSPGNYYIFANESSARGDGSLCGSATFTVKTACYSEATSPTVKEDFCGSGYSARAIPDEGGSPDVTTYHCECIPSSQLPTFNSPSNNTSGSTSHGQGFGGTNYCKDGTKGVDTALGCLPSDPGKLANVLFSIALGIAGAIAIIMIIIGGFKVAASQGNVDALQDGKDTITKAITGLVFILLATTILGIIGIDILGIPFFRRDGAGIIINQR